MLPEQDWLHKAKRLAVGMTSRTYHRNEGRANLTIGNMADRWYAWCHRCHEGAVVHKEHVRLTEALEVPDTSLVFPKDTVAVWNSEYEEPVERFLATKNMASMYLPPLMYSPSRKRLLLQSNGCWHGRDVTGRAASKWLNYSDAQITGDVGDNVVVVEDLFSMFKVRWALRDSPNLHILCALGTQDKPALVARLMNAERIIWFFDADKAGDDGAQRCQLRLRAFGHKQVRLRPPEGKDPKDMDCTVIKQEVMRCCY